MVHTLVTRLLICTQQHPKRHWSTRLPENPRNHSVVAFSHSCTPNFTPNVKVSHINDIQVDKPVDQDGSSAGTYLRLTVPIVIVEHGF